MRPIILTEEDQTVVVTNHHYFTNSSDCHHAKNLTYNYHHAVKPSYGESMVYGHMHHTVSETVTYERAITNHHDYPHKYVIYGTVHVVTPERHTLTATQDLFN